MTELSAFFKARTGLMHRYIEFTEEGTRKREAQNRERKYPAKSGKNLITTLGKKV
jgi:hypothetical protein